MQMKIIVCEITAICPGRDETKGVVQLPNQTLTSSIHIVILIFEPQLDMCYVLDLSGQQYLF